MTLSISHLSKSFGKLEVLKDISIHLNTGEFVSIIGPSGCGKTTLFDIIAGVEKQTSGKVLLEGGLDQRPMGLWPRMDSFQVDVSSGKVGYMLQKPLLLPWRTVEENVSLGLEIKKIEGGRGKKWMLEKARNLLDQFGLSSFEKFYPSQLSGGMAQRVALLRTILFHQDFLLLDEPFGALDALTRLSCQLWLQDVVKKFNSNVLFITHDIREAILLSDRIYVLSPRPGRIIDEIPVDLSRPRKPEQLQSKKAEEIEKKLLKLLLK